MRQAPADLSGVFVTFPKEGCSSFAMGRSNWRLLPPPSHGRVPGRASAGDCGAGAARRGARRAVLKDASTMGVEHVRWALARHSNWPPPLSLP